MHAFLIVLTVPGCARLSGDSHGVLRMTRREVSDAITHSVERQSCGGAGLERLGWGTFPD